MNHRSSLLADPFDLLQFVFVGRVDARCSQIDSARSPPHADPRGEASCASVVGVRASRVVSSYGRMATIGAVRSSASRSDGWTSVRISTMCSDSPTGTGCGAKLTRRGRDSNPGATLWAATRSPGVPIQPLSHLSIRPCRATRIDRQGDQCSGSASLSKALFRASLFWDSRPCHVLTVLF